MPQFHVTSPDGKTYEVNAPDGATEQDAISYVQNNVHGQAAAPPDTGPTDMATMATRGMSAGLSDYAGAAGRYGGDLVGRGIRALGAHVNPNVNIDESYNDALKGIRAGNEQFRDEHPVQAYGSEIAGGIVSPLFRGVGKGVDAGIKAIGGVPRYLGYALQGGAAGAMAGAGNAQGEGGGVPTAGDLAKSTGIGSIGGAVLGAAVPGVIEGASKLIGRTSASIAANAPRMTQDQIKTASQAAYKASEDAGVIIAPKPFAEFVADLPEEVRGLPKTPEAMSVSTPKSYGIMADLKSVADRGEPLTLKALDELRSTASKASTAVDPHDSSVAGNIVDKIDNFIENLKPDHLVPSQPAQGQDWYQWRAAENTRLSEATDALKEARSLWRTNAKLGTINDIVDTGEMLNNQNWVKGRFAALVKSRMFGSFTEEEQKAIANVARTGNLEKALKLIPWRGLQMASTYADPLMQQMKINSVRNAIAPGASSAAPQGPALSPAMAQFLAGTPSRFGAQALASSMTGGSNQRP